ncbi:MAG: DUF460 domain-containing protein [Haloferacaceae archaeon]
MTARPTALDGPVFGVDVQSGDIRGDAPSYALVVLEEREEDGDRVLTAERDVVSFRKLCRLIEDREPARVATDNAYELAADKDALVHFLQSLPAGTKLVQVTGAQRPEPLSRVADRHGVPYGKEPMAEAEAAARLAAANVGQEVTAFADTTTVKVSRGRSTGKGGWSEDRYTRRIHGNVKKRAREVESELEAAGLEFTREVTEKYGGFSNAVFTVEAPPEEIPVSSSRSGDTRVEIERERRDGIEYEPLVKRRDRVVVGIDPGTTTAAAVVDLNGAPLDVFSSRTADSAAVTEWIVERGRPALVAADVTPMPETVEKFRRSFDAAGWTPDADLPIDEKLHRTREAAYDNDHERDALAAALFAYDAHEPQFERISRKVPTRIDTEEIIARVLAEETSVEVVLDDVLEEEGNDDAESEPPQEPELTEEEREIRRLRRQVDRLEGHVEDLERQLEGKAETIEEYERKLSEARRKERREARRHRAVTRLERKVERVQRERDEARETVEELERKLERVKTLWRLDHDDFSDVAEGRGLVSVKVLDQFTKGEISRVREEYGLVSGDVVYLRDASGAGRSTAERLAEVEPRIVLREGGLSEIADAVLFDREIPVAPAGDVTIQEVDELAVARESEVEAAIADWEDRARERRRRQKADMVDRLISEHRAESGGR